MADTNSTSDFVEFPKIARLTRDMIITEKIDGTNACVYIDDAGGGMQFGSRTRWITPQDDNFGFAAWATAHADELRALGPGRHFGEWWGSGIQRGYGLPKGEKRWSLFNTSRWADRHMGDLTYTGDGAVGPVPAKGQQFAPECCYVVPVLHAGKFDTSVAEILVQDLQTVGSKAAPGFMDPEGIVVYHVQGNLSFKKTIKKDEEWKGKQ